MSTCRIPGCERVRLGLPEGEPGGGRSLIRRDVMPRARRAHSKGAELSFTERVVAELAPYTPLLPCCRRSLVEGLALVTTTPGAIATTRPVAVRAAMQSLHAEHIAAHVSRVGAARRVQYLLVGVEPAIIETKSTRVCCRRSRLRGAFLSAGRLVRPDGEP